MGLLSDLDNSARKSSKSYQNRDIRVFHEVKPASKNMSFSDTSPVDRVVCETKDMVTLCFSSNEPNDGEVK